MKYLLCLATLVLTGCFLIPDEKETETFQLPEPPKITQAVTYPVERQLIMESVEGTVRVTPIREVSLYFEVPGRIQSVDVVPDQQVAEGEVLAKLEANRKKPPTKSKWQQRLEQAARQRGINPPRK